MKIDARSNFPSFYHTVVTTITQRSEKENKSTIESSEKSSSCLNTIIWPFEKIGQFISSLFSYIFCCHSRSKKDLVEELKIVDSLLKTVKNAIENGTNAGIQNSFEGKLKKLQHLDRLKSYIALFFAQEVDGNTTNIEEINKKYSCEVNAFFSPDDNQYALKGAQTFPQWNSKLILITALLCYKSELMALNK